MSENPYFGTESQPLPTPQPAPAPAAPEPAAPADPPLHEQVPENQPHWLRDLFRQIEERLHR